MNIAGVTSIDNTGIGMLVEVHKSLDRKGIRVITGSIPNKFFPLRHPKFGILFTELTSTLDKLTDGCSLQIALTNPRLEVTEKLVLSGYIKDIIGEEWVFLTVKDAITACRYALQRSRSKDDGEV
jgi:sulfate transporter 3